MPSLTENKRFTTVAVDNIEHNTSSTTAISSFHGSSISLIQHPLRKRKVWKTQAVKAMKCVCIGALPSSYIKILPFSSQKQGGLRVLNMQRNVNGDDEVLSLATMKETEWINHMRQHVEDHQQIDKEDMQPTVAKQAGNGKAPRKNTTAMVSWSATITEKDRNTSTHDARVRCCLFLQKLLIL